LLKWWAKQKHILPTLHDDKSALTEKMKTLSPLLEVE